MGTTAPSRIEYGHEAVDALLAFTLTPGARLYGGGAWVFRSNTRNEPTLRSLGERVLDVWVAQLGADGEWFPWADGRVGLLAGIDGGGAGVPAGEAGLRPPSDSAREARPAGCASCCDTSTGPRPSVSSS